MDDDEVVEDARLYAEWVKATSEGEARGVAEGILAALGGQGLPWKCVEWLEGRGKP